MFEDLNQLVSFDERHVISATGSAVLSVPCALDAGYPMWHPLVPLLVAWRPVTSLELAHKPSPRTKESPTTAELWQSSICTRILHSVKQRQLIRLSSLPRARSTSLTILQRLVMAIGIEVLHI